MIHLKALGIGLGMLVAVLSPFWSLGLLVLWLGDGVGTVVYIALLALVTAYFIGRTFTDE